MALGSDDDDGIDDEDDDHGGGSSGVPGDELFNRCINVTLEAQEVCCVISFLCFTIWTVHAPTFYVPLSAVKIYIWRGSCFL